MWGHGKFFLFSFPHTLCGGDLFLSYLERSPAVTFLRWPSRRIQCILVIIALHYCLLCIIRKQIPGCVWHRDLNPCPTVTWLRSYQLSHLGHCLTVLNTSLIDHESGNAFIKAHITRKLSSFAPTCTQSPCLSHLITSPE